MGGEINSMELHYPDKNYTTPDLKPEEMKLDIAYINKCLGLELKETEIKRLLGKMGLDLKDGKVLIPAYRADIMHQADLVEDIAVAYGFENFKEEIPNVATIGHESRMSVLIKRIADILTGVGLLELNTYNLTNEASQNTKTLSKGKLVELESSVSGDYTHLRRWMLPTLLEVFQGNKHNEYPQKIFDAGTVFLMNPKTETGVEERTVLGVAVSEGAANFTMIRQVLDYLLLNLGVDKDKIEIKEMEHPSLIPGRVGKILVGKKEVGYIGEVHPQVLSNFQLDMPVGAFELDLDMISGIVN
jgi:phenylalanyl-tRNA synthetase beta chain